MALAWVTQTRCSSSKIPSTSLSLEAVPHWLMVVIILLSIRTVWDSSSHNMVAEAATVEVIMEVITVAVAAATVEATAGMVSHTNKTTRGTLIRNIRHNYADISNNQDHAL